METYLTYFASMRSEKAREFQKNIYFCFIDYAKAFDYVDHIMIVSYVHFKITYVDLAH